MKIPRRFCLLGSTYTVKILPKEKWTQEDAVGLFNPDINEIHILKRSPQQDVQTLWHETVHAMFHAMGRDKLYKDEPLVDLLASMIHQVITSSK